MKVQGAKTWRFKGLKHESLTDIKTLKGYIILQVGPFFLVVEFVNKNFMCWGMRCVELLGHRWAMSFDFFGKISPNFDLKNMISTYTKDF